MNFVRTAVLTVGMISLVACGGSSDSGDTMNTANPCEATEANPCETTEEVTEEVTEEANPCGDAANPCGM